MSELAPLIDRAALRRNRARATTHFLHELARDEAEDRLAMVNRTFTEAAVVTPFPEVWDDFGAARIVPDEDILGLTENSHDLVVHAMCLHWANDPVGQLIQCRRALRPDGLLLALTLGGQTLQELRAALAQAESEISGGLSPRVLPMGEIRDLGALLQRAGLALPVADAWPLCVSYETPLHVMRDLRAMGEANALGGRTRQGMRRAVLLRASELYTAHFGHADGRVPASFEIITLTGWSPDSSQQQPLRPGSAAHRLAEALGTRETSLKD